MPERPLTPEELRWEQQLMDELLVRGMAPQQGPPERLRQPTMRAASWLERLNERGKDAYEWLAESSLSPLKIPEALGLTDLRGKVKESADPEALFAGTMDLPPGKAISAAARGLYSRVDDALSRLPAKGAHPNKILSILKSNASQEELAYRKVPEFLAAQGNTSVTPGALQQHLAANPAPMPKVKTLAVTPGDELAKTVQLHLGMPPPATPQAWQQVSARFEREAQQWQRNGDPRQAERFFQLSEESMSMAEGLDLGRGLSAGQPKYAQYQVPGGENYRETLLSLPPRETPPAEFPSFEDWVQGNITAEYQGAAHEAPNRRVYDLERRDAANAAENRLREQSFRSSHFDEPNVLVHTRANERTLPTGERGRFVEEVQSDWYQKLKSLERKPGELNIKLQKLGAGDTPAHQALRGQIRDAEEAVETFRATTPKTPFEDAWPDLGLKQQLLETAADPDATWMGFTSGGTQAARYDLSKHVDEIHYQPEGRRLLAFTKEGDKAIDEIVDPDKLADYIGKEAAEKLQAQPFDNEYKQSHVLRGAQLQVGGEGMRKFYDELLPRRFEKMLKPFGGTVEQAPLNADRTAKLAAQNAHYYESGAISEAEYLKRKAEMEQPINAWIARLSPEMKARILKEGLPLMALPLAATAGLGWLGPLAQGAPEQDGR